LASRSSTACCWLQIAIKESNVISYPSNIPIAKAALQQLLVLVQAKRDGAGGAEATGGDGFALTEADVLKTMVKVHQQVCVYVQQLHWWLALIVGNPA
jgi:hypothetical protein